MYRENSVPVKLTERYLTWQSLAVKRVFDIIISFLLLVILLPYLGLIALAIKHDSPGRVFYRGMRVGKKGKPFWILKFRTMYETPESYQGPRVTAQDDTRITRIGRWLRETKLNELPQLWNVLIGDMSLVGPRPEDPTIARTWPRDAWNEIFSVRPGITSPASVLYHAEESMLISQDVLQKYLKDLSPDKRRLDQLYIRYRFFLLDLDVLLWTILVILPRLNTYLPPEQLLFVGPITRLIQRYINWFGIDILVALIAIGFTGLLWRAPGPLDIGILKAFLVALGFSLLFSVMSALWGNNRIQWQKALDSDVLFLLPPWILATSAALALNQIFKTLPTGLVLVASLLALSGFIIVRFHQKLITGLTKHILSIIERSNIARERVLIVGSGRTAEHVAWILTHPSYARQYQILGFIDDDLHSQGMRIYGSKVIGLLRELPSIIKKFDVGLVILADHRLDYQEFIQSTGIKDTQFVPVIVAPDLFGSMNMLISPIKNRNASNNGERSTE
jgi:lipopolysaccharide/colanic/teichoic acid biosynthesis glycosyltransferase